MNKEIRVVAFHPRHVEVMELRSFEESGIFSLSDAYARNEALAKASIQSGTFIYGGRILFCAGFIKVWEGVLDVWMTPSIHIKSAGIVFPRMLKRYIQRIGEDFKAHRIQTTSYDDPFHERWMKFLGFKKEGTMEKYTHDKKNMCAYARIF